jgi:hypothetical protein
MRTYKLSSKWLGRRRLFAVLALLVAVGVAWMAITTDDTLNRIWLIAIGIGSGWTALNLGLRILFSNPTLKISKDGINVTGYYPVADSNNWARELHWNEIGLAKMLNKEVDVQGAVSAKTRSTLVLLYDKADAEKVVGTVADFQYFESPEEITQVISQYLGQPLVEETVKEVR